MPRQIRLNAFDMDCAGHQSPGLWTHPRNRAARYDMSGPSPVMQQLMQYPEHGRFRGAIEFEPSARRRVLA